MTDPKSGTPLRLRDTPLGLVPWLELALASPLSADEVCERVGQRLDNRLLGRDDPERPFAGYSADGRLVISHYGARALFPSPTLAARVEAREPGASTGSHLRVRLRPGSGVMLWLGAWTFVLALVTGALITQHNFSTALGVLGALMLPWVACSWTFRREAPRMLALLEDSCAATRVPSDKPRTF